MTTLTLRVQEYVTLKQGAGGRAMRALIEDVFLEDQPAPPAKGIGAGAMDDGAAIWLGDRYLVVTTDSHVVHPLFFPGGDIGRLSVSGTVNDLAMMGATEVLGLTCAAVIEEGFLRSDLERIQDSIRRTCREAGATIVTGDTKVMGRGEIDGVVLNTTGIGLTDRVVPRLRPAAGRPHRRDGYDRGPRPRHHGNASRARPRRRALLGRGAHQRPDAAALAVADGAVVAMKDPTRGGLSSALHEMAEKSGVGILLEEARVPVTAAARAAGDLLGIDPLHVANEGKAVLGVSPQHGRARRRSPPGSPARPQRLHRRHLRRRTTGVGHPRHGVREASSGGARGRAASPHMLMATRTRRLALMCSRRCPGLSSLLRGHRRGLFDLVACLTSDDGFAERARLDAAGVPVIDHPIRPFYSSRQRPIEDLSVRSDYDRRSVELLATYRPDVLLLSSYLYVLTDPVLEAFPNRILNVHASDLARRGPDGRPLYPGLRAVRMAILAGEEETRATVHLVTERLDEGPILLRSRPYPVSPLVGDLRRCGNLHAVHAYAFAHEEWMLAMAWGPLLIAGAALLSGQARPFRATEVRGRTPVAAAGGSS